MRTFRPQKALPWVASILLVGLVGNIILHVAIATAIAAKSPHANGILHYETLSLERTAIYRRGATTREPTLHLAIALDGETHELLLTRDVDLIPVDMDVPVGFDRHAWYTGTVNETGGVSSGSVVQFTVSEQGNCNRWQRCGGRSGRGG